VKNRNKEILNESYYNSLLDKYSIYNDIEWVACLTTKLILKNYKKNNLHFNFPKGYDLQKTINLIYETLSKQIFKEYADITDYSKGDRLKKNGKKGKEIYVIYEIKGNEYILTIENDSSNTRIVSSFDKLKRNYTKILKNTRNKTLQKFHNYFKNINIYGFTPQHFSKKIVFIAGQNTWENLKNKNCIPTTYLPNTREGEQTVRKSIDALEDSIAFVTPKYDVCYEEILMNNIAVDTMIVCDTDLSSITQIIQDKSKYDFNLIVLSNNNEVQQHSNLTLWNWQQEEIGLLGKKPNKRVIINCINEIELNTKILHFEKCMQYISLLEIPIKLKSYGYFFRLSLNALQEEHYNYLLMRLRNNRELERNDGGYEDFGENNPKEALKNVIMYLKENNPKLRKVNELISNTTKKILFVVDVGDIEFFRKNGNRNCFFITQKELKKKIKNGEIDSKPIAFYSFNALKDFNFIYNLQNDIVLVLYKQEEDLYNKQLQIHTNLLEEELTSEDRYKICNIKYEPIVKPEIKVCPTLEQIIERLEQRSNTAYDGYKDESDSLLDDLEEEIIYKINFANNNDIRLGSNETVFDDKGNLIKSYLLNVGDKIRIYPKEQLAENLFQIAVEVEPNKFGMIDEHAIGWQKALKDLEQQITDREQLYNKLKENGLKVLPATVDAYLRGQRKFPMYNTDLLAILKVAGKELLYEQIKKSKRLFNSTMIALGRGVKQEIQQFLKDQTVGDILQKKDFTKETLHLFINKYMPLLTITNKEEVINEQ